ncbi:hypothetical protein GIB67_009885 [Kingdonia uniflora]|uniref:Uncharacterized protein n=1 Tax=Kingdonia uniflora TaxID=39325 RepID=A0A7J7L7T2_9MAGN|nr:hypothetical protein GIB67_009885 [Kingdonia uniflora]
MGGPSGSSDKLLDSIKFLGEKLFNVLLATFLSTFPARFNPSFLRLTHHDSRAKILYTSQCLKSLPPFKP